MPVPLQDTIPLTELLPAADTLGLMPTDSLAVDSLAAVVETVPVRIWDAAAVYGDASETLVQTVTGKVTEISPLTGNIWFQVLSLVILGFYCWMVYYYRNQIVMCLKGLVNFKPEDKFTAEQGHLYDRFINFGVIMSIVAMGILVTKGISVAVGPGIADAVPGWLLPLAVMIVSAVMVAILAAQLAILNAAGKLTVSSELTDSVVQAKKLHLAAAAVVAVPVILLHTGLNPICDAITAYIAITEIVAIAIIFTVKTFLLFMRQKVSVLVWFLYLCAVEIFPISLIVLLVAKNV